MFTRFLLPILVLVCVVTNPAKAEVIRSGELLVRSGVAAEVHEFELSQTQTLQVTLGKISTVIPNSTEVVGRLLIVSGTTRPLELDLDTRNHDLASQAITLEPGKYSLVAYVDFADDVDGVSVPVFIEMETDSGQALYSRTFQLAAVDTEKGNIVELSESLSLSSGESLTLKVKDEGFGGSQVYQPFVHAALVISKDGSPVVMRFLLGGASYEEGDIELDAGNYQIQWSITGAKSGLSALELEISSASETFQKERVVINDTDDVYGEVIDTFSLESKPEGYDIKVASFLGTNIEDCEVELVNTSSVISLETGTVSADLEGEYQLRISCAQSKTTAVGIRIVDAVEETVFYSNVITLGGAQLVDTFKLAQAENINIRTTDVGFLNAFRNVSILVTDGAAQDFMFDYQQSTTVEGTSKQLEGGKDYFIVVIPESSVANGNGVLRLVASTSNGTVVSNEMIFHGVDTGVFFEGIPLSAGEYTLTVQDHGFPVVSDVLGIALFKDNTRIKSIQFGSSGDVLKGGTTDKIPLVAGNYDVLVVMGSEDGGALVGYSIDQVSVATTDSGADRGTGSNSGGSGGGGGGSLSVLTLLALGLLARRRLN